MVARLRSLFLRNTGVRQTVLKNTSWLFLGELVGRVIRFSIVIYAARLLGAAEYGVFSYALTIGAFLTIFSDLGISPVLTREGSKDKLARQRYFSSGFVLKLILIAINTVILLAVIPIFSRVEAAHVLFPLVALVFIFDSLRGFGMALNRAMEAMEREAVIKILLNSAVAILGFIFLMKTASAYSLALAYVLGTGFGLVLTVAMLWKYFVNVFSEVEWPLVWKIFKTALPIGLLGVLGAITINTDMIMLGWWRSEVEIGLYASAQKIILLLYIIPGLIASAAFPVFSRLANVNNARFKLVFQRVIRTSFLLSIPITVGGFLLSDRLIPMLFGVEYIGGVTTFSILIFTVLIVFPSTIVANALFAYNRQKQFIWFVAIGAIGNALLNCWLIPEYGIEGSAVATIISQSLANIFVWIKMKQTNDFHVFRSLWRALVAVVIMTGVVFGLSMLGMHTLLIILLGAVVYGAILMLLREPVLFEIKDILNK